jgi:hypothetical protein
LNPPPHDAPAAHEDTGYIPLPHPIKRKMKDGMVALTMATWCFVRPWAHLLLGGRDYFNGPPVLPVELLALAANILGVALLIFLGIGIWRRFRTGVAPLVLDLCFLSLLVFPADFIRVQVLGQTNFQLAGLLKQPVLMLSILVVLIFLIWKHRLVARIVAMVIVVTLPVALLIMARIILVCLNLMTLTRCPYSVPPPPLLPVREDQPRVVWIIFDETDYRVLFEKRPANVLLPEFDLLRKEALSPDHAYPPSDTTILSMPILITGQRISAVKKNGCDLDLTLADSGAIVEWSALPSVFSQARELGVNTALVGWYHPYARMLGGSLNYCSWYPFPFYEPARSTTFGGAMEQQIVALLEPICVRQVFINICKDSLADAVAVVANPNYGLILLHLPPPHGPGVYLPERNGFTCLGIALPDSYFNNLMLADHELGALRRAMETSGQWDKSWVILSADHSWRKSQSYDGIRDYRVPFLVKSPGVSESIAYSHQFNTAVMTHDLILAILRGEVTNQASAATLLDRGKPDMPVPGGSTPSTQ